MEAVAARGALEVLAGIDVSVADHAELASAAVAMTRLQSFVDVVKVQLNRRTRALAEAGDRSSEHVLIDEGRLSGRDAKANDERDRVCTELPQFEDALASGECTAGHLDALARHTKGLSDAERSDLRDVADDLLGAAAADPVDLFDRKAKELISKIRDMHGPDSDIDELDVQRSRSNVKRWTDQATGMKHTHLELDPIRDATLWNVIDHHLARLRAEPANSGRSFAELQIDAVVAAINCTSTSSPDVGDDQRRTPEIVIHADAASLCHGRHDQTMCETVDGAPIPVATAQRLCCEAVLQAVVVNPDGTIDQLCAEQRTASRQQRRLLAAMYSSCAHPYCGVAFSHCRIHHITWWTRGGTTVLGNLVPLCETHHHLVHEGRWDLTIDEQRHITWHRPDGTIWTTDSGPNRPLAPPTQQPPRRTKPQSAA